MEYAIVGGLGIFVVVVLLLIIKVETLRNRANALFLEAEKNITEDKFNYVCENLYGYVPNVAKIFLNEDTFKVIVQKIYDSTRELAKDLLDDGKRNKSNKGE